MALSTELEKAKLRRKGVEFSLSEVELALSVSHRGGGGMLRGTGQKEAGQVWRNRFMSHQHIRVSR